jgi:hypothetical protein
MSPSSTPPLDSGTSVAVDEGTPVVEIIEELSGALDRHDQRAIDRWIGDISRLVREHEKSLKRGSEEFASHRAEHKAIRAELAAEIAGVRPKPASKMPYYAMALTVFLAFAGALWQAAKYPDRPEFNTARSALEQRTQDLTLQATLHQRDISELREANKRLEQALQAAQSKIDQLLLHRGP